MRRNRIEEIEFVYASIAELGILVHPASRLAILKRLIEEIQHLPGGKMTIEHPEFNVTLECVRDFSILSFVFDTVPNDCRDSKFVSTLERVLGGPVLPQDRVKNSPERDFEFELFTYAACHSAHLLPIVLEEPDIICTFQGSKLAIAAKRIKSPNKFIDRIDAAADQIQKSGNAGVIVADITAMLDPNNQRASFEPLKMASYKQHQAELIDFVMSNRIAIGRCIGQRKIIAIILHSNIVNLVPNGVWSLVWRNFLITLDEGKKYFRAQTFYKRYSEGLGTDLDFRSQLHPIKSKIFNKGSAP